MSLCIFFRPQPPRTNFVANQSNSFGCVGGAPVRPKFPGVATNPVPKWCCQMRFTITLVSPAFERITEPFLDNLRKLGARASMKVVNDAIYEGMLRNHDFDMVVSSFGQSLSPGNEQRDFWHSESAGREGSRNLIGITSPAVDALVERVIKAPDRGALVTATRALDRVLWHGHYMVPHWFIARHRLTYWNKFSHPETLPLYYNPFGFLLYWWVDAGKEQALQAAVQAGKPVSAVR